MTRRDTLALISAHVYSPDTIPTGVLPPEVTRLYLPPGITKFASDAGFIAEAYRNELTGETYCVLRNEVGRPPEHAQCRYHCFRNCAQDSAGCGEQDS